MVERSWAFFDNDDSLQVAEEGIARKFKRIKDDGVKESQGARSFVLVAWGFETRFNTSSPLSFPGGRERSSMVNHERFPGERRDL